MVKTKIKEYAITSDSIRGKLTQVLVQQPVAQAIIESWLDGKGVEIPAGIALTVSSKYQSFQFRKAMDKLPDVIFVIVIAVPFAICWTKFLIVEDGVLAIVGERIQALPQFFKQLLTCNVCLSGQIALWLYPLTFYSTYSFFNHVAAVTCSMLIAAIIVHKLLA